MTAPASFEPNAQPSLQTLRVAFRSPSHFLLSYCSNVQRGILFVQSEPGFEPEFEPEFQVGQELRLDLHIPGQSSSHVLPATVCWIRSHAGVQGPPGVGLRFEGVEELLAPIVDRLVQIAQPLRIDLVGANAYTTRHLASSVQTAVDCRIQHRELRHDVVQRCMGADLVVIDLESNPQGALEMIDQLAQCTTPPALLALCDEEEQSILEAACRRAYVTTYPVDHRALRERIIQGLAQCNRSRGQCRGAMQDTLPVATVSAAARGLAKPARRSPTPRPARLSLHPVHRQKTAQPWLVDASWQQRPQRAQSPAASTPPPDAAPTPRNALSNSPASQQEPAHKAKASAKAQLDPPPLAGLQDTQNDPPQRCDSLGKLGSPTSGPSHENAERPESPTSGPSHENAERPESPTSGPSHENAERLGSPTSGPSHENAERLVSQESGPIHENAKRLESQESGPSHESRDCVEKLESQGSPPSRDCLEKPESQGSPPSCDSLEKPQSHESRPSRDCLEKPQNHESRPSRNSVEKPESQGSPPSCDSLEQPQSHESRDSLEKPKSPESRPSRDGLPIPDTEATAPEQRPSEALPQLTEGHMDQSLEDPQNRPFQRSDPQGHCRQGDALQELAGAEDARAADPKDSPANDPQGESGARKSA